MPKEIDALLGALSGMPCSKRIFRVYVDSITPLVADLLGIPERRIKVKILRIKRDDRTYTKELVIRLAMPEGGVEEC